MCFYKFTPPTGTVLEVSSKTGEQAIFFAPRLPKHKWIPSDPNPVARASIEAWRKHCPAQNLYERDRPIAFRAGFVKLSLPLNWSVTPV